MSCHGGGAETPVKSPLIPPANLPDAEKLSWFVNVKAGAAKDEGSISLDYSLQMAVALQNWKRWSSQNAEPGGLSVAPMAEGVEIEHPVTREGEEGPPV
jgi:hypothetical protein